MNGYNVGLALKLGCLINPSSLVLLTGRYHVGIEDILHLENLILYNDRVDRVEDSVEEVDGLCGLTRLAQKQPEYSCPLQAI